MSNEPTIRRRDIVESEVFILAKDTLGIYLDDLREAVELAEGMSGRSLVTVARIESSVSRVGEYYVRDITIRDQVAAT